MDDGELHCRECEKHDDIGCNEYVDKCAIWQSLEVPVCDAVTTIDGVKYRVRIEKERP